MGLLIKLQNGDTALKSLKFGKDRPGGGESGQPYIQNPIDKVSSPANTDFLLRGGINAPLNAAEDVARLTKYMFNPKSPSGLLFIVKQNLLSRVAPKTEASFGPAYAGGGLNAGVYNPLSTIAQAGVGFLGTHLNKQGIDPTGLISSLSIRKYSDVISTQIFFDKERSRSSTNRLINLWDRTLISSNISDTIDSYSGGPGSILGIGKTRIKYATDNEGVSQRTGINNSLYKINNKYFEKGGIKLYSLENRDIKYFGEKNILSLFTQNGGVKYNPKIDLKNEPTQNFITSSTISGSLYKESEASKNSRLNLKSWETYSDPLAKQPNGNATYIVDIREKYLKADPDLNHPINIETRINLGDPGAVKGTWTADIVSGSYKDQVMDLINGSPIYSSTAIGKNKKDYNDLVAFRIGVIDNENPTNTYYMNFRAYIDSFSDSYNADWKAQSYMGRGEKFYKYEGFSRDISLAFTVVAQSQGEMNGMYQKLNYLASSLAPYYTGQGYMAGNLVKLTFGDYIYEQVGFISSLTYDIPEESSWELSLRPDGKVTKEGPNPDELPFMIKVTGMKFTPIHQFRPEIQNTPGKGIGKRFITNNIPFKQDWHNNLKNV